MQKLTPQKNNNASSRPENTLARKGLILLSIPLTIQLFLTLGLFLLSYASEEYCLGASRSKRDHDSNSRCLLSIYAAASLIQDRAENSVSHDINRDYWIKRIPELTESQSRIIRNMGLDASGLELLAKQTLGELDRSRIAVNGDLGPGQYQTEQFRDFLNYVRGTMICLNEAACGPPSIKRHFEPLAAARLLFSRIGQKGFPGSCPEYTRDERDWWAELLILTTVVDLLLLLYLGFLFSRHIIRRLSIILDNSIKLGNGQELNAPMVGNDEIAQLDLSFHGMAKALDESTRIQKSMINNASDLICSLDENGRFILSSRSSAAILGYDSEELWDMYFVDLVSSEEQSKTVKQLQTIIKSKGQSTFETTVKRKDGKTIEMLWNTSWSPFEETLFCVGHDISVRKAAERIQREVVNLMSKDLKEPLTSINAFHEQIAGGSFAELTEKGKKLLGTSKRSTARMLTLINDLLDYDGMETGQRQLTIKELDLDTILNQAVESIHLLAEEKQIHVIAEQSGLKLQADGQRLMQVLLNLLSNALKYTPAGKKITISAHSLGQLIEIRVADQGIGIPESAIASVFGRFEQVSSADSKVHGGSGLGLAICKMLVELHGGDISVESKENLGTTFSFRLPVQPLKHKLQEQPADSEDKQ